MYPDRFAISILFPNVNEVLAASAIEASNVQLVAQESFDTNREYSTYFSEYVMPKGATSVHLLFIFQDAYILADSEDNLATALEKIKAFKSTKASIV